jgi:CheY-like chemotaxis protein
MSAAARPVALLVDDDADFRSLLGEVLRDEGYDVAEAANGLEAVALLESQKPDVMIVDLAMPVMNGWTLFAVLERKSELRSIPVVFLSAMPHMAPGGGSMVVGKPLNVTSLTKLLAALRPRTSSGDIPLKTSPRIAPVYELCPTERRH